MNQQLSIIIPSKNEGKGIIDVIKLISSQINCRIIVVDSSTEESSILLLTAYQSTYKNIEIIDGGLPAIARNNGAKLVTTPYILFLDADTYLYNDNIINNCLDICINGNYDLVTCKFTTDKKYNWIYRIFDIFQWISSKTKPFALGGFMLFRTQIFNNLGRFNEEDKIAEDYHLSSKIKPSCFKITNNFVYTPSRRFSKKGIWYMISLAWNAWINRHNDEWFKKDYNYWK
jgi:glycosyltransferase involved in cell wall biosynthesis